ncbi:MAG: hypothetical protein R8N23_18610 [Reichenbachiella sp.]|uniref:hypothetical protein n=1 Tax=Reichenbachiella sp. TaxID=2184521 RepID=UPI0029669ED2|nr:hypothetical protein [Reichenbachiella sp.]MDW3211889.1 hypothetical protein [Reichenbachiella sp.]
MLKTILTILIAFGSISFGFAQGTIAPDLKQTQLKITILPLGASLEQKLGKKQSLNLAGGLQLGAYAYSSSNGSGTEFYAAPFFTGEIRNYYNRKFVKKDLEQNSGNYVALAFGYSGNRLGEAENVIFENSFENSFFVGPVWGFQRNYKTGFHLNLSIGLGYVDGEYVDGAVKMISTGGIGFFLR